jgi:Flp pilus assembly protein TadG
MGPLAQKLKTLKRDESGAALVEFALVIPIVLTLLLGALDLGKAFNYWIDETHLSHEGARYAAVNKNPGPGATLQESIKGQADTPELKTGGTSSVPSALQVCIDFPNGTTNVGDPVRVKVIITYRFLSFLVPKLGGRTEATMEATSTMRLERPPTNYTAGCA